MGGILDFFEGNEDVVRYVPRLEGQDVGGDGAVLLGDRAGPACSLKSLAHEMCHLVEIDEARMRQVGWGLRLREVEIFGRVYQEPVTIQATRREIRVMAYQANLMEWLGMGSIGTFVRSMRFMPDFTFVPLETGEPAFGEGAPEVSYLEGKESRLRWIRREVEGLRSCYTLERFRSEWARRVLWLRGSGG